MRARSQIAERSLPYAKAVPASAMRACSQIAERSLPYAKVIRIVDYKKLYRLFQPPQEILRYGSWNFRIK